MPTMRVGELCRVVCSSDYGYGDAGDPPEIPPRATLTFEMELMGVRCMLRGAEADTTARDTARRLEQLKLEREREVAEAAVERGDAAARKAAAKAAAAERLANKGQKKGSGKKKK